MSNKVYEITIDLGFGTSSFKSSWVSAKNKQEAIKRALRNYPYAKVVKLKVLKPTMLGTTYDLVMFDEFIEPNRSIKK